ncbi:hypothetical protein [Commensalibacter nepenthis]|uniref:DUF2474 domain-containing protein n=1 Tax=Commensalibacter nepenthis TaxID=3043872 RepID=A0ABT6Q5H1_9PROT|nr:hypothetical protein [Commensalibacter sp. TBRC 10068]MDI2112142.1 hypothetical protein [Commensalibacter sp. TBRC 10068]
MMKGIINRTKNIQLKQWQWFIVLWLSGVLSLGIVAQCFRVLLLMAKNSLYH